MSVRRNVNGVLAAIRGDDNMRYRVAERVAKAIHPQAVLSGRDRIWMADQDVREIYERFKGRRAYRSWDRVYLLDQLASYVSDLPGDTVECGSFEGLSSYVMCRRTQPGKVHHVFDSFAGLSAPGESDGSYWRTGELAASEALVVSNLAGFDVETHKGWIPDRFGDVADSRFCLTHIDVDLHQPTLDSLAFFFERTVPGGVIVCDDYGFGTCPGAKAAVDEFLADTPEVCLSIPTGQGVIFRR